MKKQNRIQKENKATPNEPQHQERPLPRLSDLAIYFLQENFERIARMPFFDAVACLNGMADALRGNKNASGIVAAVDQIDKAENYLLLLHEAARKINAAPAS